MTSERRIPPNLEEAVSAIPIFPLPHVVLFPGATLPLHVFEPRYRKMLADCLAGSGAIAIGHLLPGEDEHGRPRIARVAGGGLVVEHEELPDGRSNIVVLGKARLALDELDAEGLPYRRARATILADEPGAVPDSDRTALVAAATMFATEVKKHDHTFSLDLNPSASTAELTDLCAFQLVVDRGVRQALLEELAPRARVRILLDQLALQHGAMRPESRGKMLN